MAGNRRHSRIQASRKRRGTPQHDDSAAAHIRGARWASKRRKKAKKADDQKEQALQTNLKLEGICRAKISNPTSVMWWFDPYFGGYRTIYVVCGRTKLHVPTSELKEHIHHGNYTQPEKELLLLALADVKMAPKRKKVSSHAIEV